MYSPGQDNLSKEKAKDSYLKTVAHSLNLCGFGTAKSHADRDAVVTLLSRGSTFLVYSLLTEINLRYLKAFITSRKLSLRKHCETLIRFSKM